MPAPSRTKRDFLRLTDLSREELLELLERAAEWKLLGKRGPRPLEHSTIGLLFEKASTRTRVSFQVGAWQLGAHAMFLSPRDTQLGRGEPIQDTARVLSRYLDALVVRTFEHADPRLVRGRHLPARRPRAVSVTARRAARTR